ncbi:MAG: DUF4221 family protein [Lunatimonas sp.]|uniref:DUF4221 family protein n=1 Tax=Lunatimonas sp. TaxID=2060141 RepID=UPI00263BC692|nr:DUF4221 family protein [Lunatimonas sp.]MCC5938277.1 DUF4221 family protein [Lunatimonas sp.]
MGKSNLTGICMLGGMAVLGCTKPTSNNTYYNQVSIYDTVSIDSKGELLFLNWSLSTATVSSDLSTLYNFNVDEPSLEVVDLDKYILSHKVPLEREGPNGIGQRGKGGILALSDQLLFFKGWPAPYVMDLQGRRTGLLENLTLIKSSVTPAGRDFMYEIMYPDFPNLVFGITNEFPGKNFEFTVLDLIDNSIKSTTPLSAWDNFSDYSLVFDDGTQFDLWAPRVYVTLLGQYICLSTDVSSDLYLYDPRTETLIFKEFPHSLSPKHKTPTGSIQTSDPAQFQTTFRKLYGDVSFHPPFWDNDNQVYYRFSHTTTFERSEEGLYPKLTEQQVYLSVIEGDFTLSAEFSLDFLKDAPAFGFSKEGKIWTYLNVNDEMGFIRMKAPHNAP